MSSKAKERNMRIHRNTRPAPRAYGTLSKIVLAALAMAFGGCTLPSANGFVPPAPMDVVPGAESAPPAAFQDDVEAVLTRMEAAYAQVRDYQTEVEILYFNEDGSFWTEKALYTFKKPKWIRLDFVSPNPGTIMVYPDPNGRVAVQPQGLLSILTLHLMLDDPLLEAPSGQRLNQTDLGLLLMNIRHSVTDQRRGPLSISEDKDAVQIQVLADDHFRLGVETRYRFSISKEIWLPVEVGQSMPNGVPEGRIIFRNLRTNINVPDALFQ